MRAGRYVIVKMTKGDEQVTLFFLPDDKKSVRKSQIRSYEVDGYAFLAEAHVDKETYLNERLNIRVREYCDADKYEQYIREQCRKQEMKPDVFWDTMRCCQDNKWTSLMQIDMLVRRLARNDFDVQNEIALQLVDQYRQAVI